MSTAISLEDVSLHVLWVKDEHTGKSHTVMVLKGEWPVVYKIRHDVEKAIDCSPPRIIQPRVTQ